MYNYKITLEYEGTRYDGWQKQGNTGSTVQGKLEAVLKEMAGEYVEVHGSGRTDAGVHAQGQVANFHLQERKEPKEIQAYLNHYLPEDIAVLEAEEVPERFHSRLNAKRKLYVYQICTGQKRHVFTRRMQYGFGKKLDVEAMKQAAGYLMGTHDFKSFSAGKNKKKSTVRTLYTAAVHQDGDDVVLAFQGDGFLYHMVRILAGTLIEVGLGKRMPESMTDVLKACDRSAAGFTAPPEGLSLVKVFYE